MESLRIAFGEVDLVRASFDGERDVPHCILIENGAVEVIDYMCDVPGCHDEQNLTPFHHNLVTIFARLSHVNM